MEPQKCAKLGCTNSFKDHFWGSIKADNDGWFRQKNGDNWCPNHNPKWVAAWREKNGRRAT